MRGHLKYIEALLNHTLHSKADYESMQKQVYTLQTTDKLPQDVLEIVSKDYSYEKDWLQNEFSQSKEFDI